MNCFSRQLRWFFVLSLVLLALVAQAVPLLKAGDRVVIYGDSITEQRLYSRFLQQYITCRYPEMKISFYNAGWSGDTAGGALKRLDRDVLSLHPTVVTLFFGMNDGGYRKLDQTVLDTYRANMEGLIKALQEKNIRTIVYTPGCSDHDRNPKLKDANYNVTLEALAKIAMELATKYNCASEDIFHPMLTFQDAQKALDSTYSMMPDSVHPLPNGHLLMTYYMLQGLGAEPMPALGSFDAQTGTAKDLRVITNDDASIVLETLKPIPVPFWFDQANLSTMRTCGFLDFTGQKLTVSGLKAAKYTVVVGDAQPIQFTREELAAGVNTANLSTTRGSIIQTAIMDKENIYYTGWRTIKLSLVGYAGD